MTPATKTADFTPIFDWSSRRGRRFPLLSFVAVSAILHAFCFYVFQIVYPVTVALTPPPARINLITAETEQGRVLLRWLEAEDPALASTTQRPADTLAALPPEPSHIPSYLRRQPMLRQLPRAQPDLRIPSSQPPGPVMLPQRAPPAPAGTVATRVHFAESAGALGRPVVPSLPFTASIDAPPAAAQFRIGIGALGTVQYCFLENSSGDRALDEQARRALLLCRFPALRADAIPPDRLSWTTATWQWGNDIALPAKHSPETPAP